MSLFSFNFVLIVHIRPAFYGNVNTNASESLKTSYDHYKCLANNKNDLRLVTKMLRICFPSEFLEHISNIRNTSKSSANVFESIRMIGDQAAIIANWWRIAFVSSFVRYSLRCKSSISNPIRTKNNVNTHKAKRHQNSDTKNRQQSTTTELPPWNDQ